MVRLIRDSDTFIDRLPIFASEGFLKAKGEEYGWIGDEHYISPFFIDKRGGFRRLVLSNEPVALMQASAKEEKKHLNELAAVARQEIKADFITGHFNAVFSVTPDFCESVDWGSYIVSLDGDEETLLKNMQARTRTKVRNAMRAGVQVSQTDNIDDIYEILKATMIRQQELFFPSKKYLSLLKRNLGEHAIFFICKHKNKVQGGVVMLFNYLKGYYYYGGSIQKPVDGSMPFMHLEIMKFLKHKSIPYYDLMGARMQLEPYSKNIGVQQFKHRLGGRLYVGKTFKIVLRPMRYFLYQLLLKAYFFAKGSRYKGDLFVQVKKAASMPDVVLAPGADKCIQWETHGK